MRDVFQSFYSLSPRKNDESELSDTARLINSRILKDMTDGEDHAALKAVCEGRRLPAYEAASEFVEHIAENLDSFLETANGGKKLLNVLEKLREKENSLRETLERRLSSHNDGNILKAANALEGKARQAAAVERIIRENLQTNAEAVKLLIVQAMLSAKEKADETALALAAWGDGGGGSDKNQSELDQEIIDKVRRSETLREITKYLGRFKEMAAKSRKNGYAYGRGEKYSLEYGNDLSRVVSSELASLALKETLPLFLRKHQRKRLLQYKRREAVFKGGGDIIMCLDESDSTSDVAAWGKALALTLLDAAGRDGRSFALVHFSDKGSFKTDIFRKGQYATEDIFTAAETFLGGGTDFETPLAEALRIINAEGFENADIVFVTDGICALADEFADEFGNEKAARGFTVTGVLLDAESPGMGFSLTPFCDVIYRTSELTTESVAEEIVLARV
ncbi:MAG: hypothetical protein LBK23_07025 [Oscillospiraceae bacterium]|jgi:uncharacterized protein with von Willebrand factor type A (vWA) domain|nr:hypothetical protein [Oscillospiraceae bacterium]